MLVIGKCKLCFRDAIDLKESHFLPRGIYKILREANTQNPNPVLVTRSVSVQTSRQFKKHLLCENCEDLLNKNGETWVLRRCLQSDGRFELAEILAARKPKFSESGNPTKIYYASEYPEINVAKLSFFAASIFWRGSIFPWNDDGSTPVELGPFQEEFRQYLLGKEPFPKHACLWVALREGRDINRLTHVPKGERRQGAHVYRFAMPGIVFMLFVGKNIPESPRYRCFVHRLEHPIMVTSIVETVLIQDAAALMRMQPNEH